MNKRITSILLSVVLIVSMFAVSAVPAYAIGCDCASHLVLVPESAATCTTPGIRREHYKCSNCGELYEDVSANEVIEDRDSVVIDARGHDYIVRITDEAHKRSTAADCREYDTYWLTCANDITHSAKDDPAAADRYYNYWPGPHSYGEDWVRYDQEKHGHQCVLCWDMKDFTPHRPGAPATETTPQVCLDCGCELTSATGHLCISHLVEVPRVDPDCTTPGTEAHYKCSDPDCGKLYWDDDAFEEITNPDELVIPVLEHNWASEWSSDEYNHWHTCTSCNATADLHAHDPDHEGGATLEYPILCTECGYVMEEQLVEATLLRVELPFRLTVKQTDEMAPGPETFRFLAEDFGAPVDYVLLKDTVETDGVKTYDGIFAFTIPEEQWGNLSEGFFFRQIQGNAEGWTYDQTVYYAVPEFRDNNFGVSNWIFYSMTPDGWPDYNNPMEEADFTNSYAAKKPVEPPQPSNPVEPTQPSNPVEPTQPSSPVEPTQPSSPVEPTQPSETVTPNHSQSPQTGDHSQPVLWVSLLLVSSAVGIALVSRQRRCNTK